jgi:hypothetical protein
MDVIYVHVSTGVTVGLAVGIAMAFLGGGQTLRFASLPLGFFEDGRRESGSQDER